MNAFEIPGLRYSLPAGGAVARHRFVSADANSNGIQATASTKVIGVSMNQTAEGEVLEIADGLVIVEAAGAITAGSAVEPNADGKAVTSSGAGIGIAVTGATGDGSLITVKM